MVHHRNPADIKLLRHLARLGLIDLPDAEPHECLLKLIAFGPTRFVSDAFNIFDSVVVLAGLR